MAGVDDELSLRLTTPADLFRTPDPGHFPQTGRLESGMDELVQELTPRRLHPGGRVVVVLPAEHVRPETGEQLRRAVQDYCRLRIRQVERALRVQTREVATALGIGGLLFVTGLTLAYWFAQANEPTPLQVLLGNGLFLVIAWVGLWYPLDALVFGRRPLLRERRVWAAVLTVELIVRAAGGNTPGPGGATVGTG